MLNLTQSDCRHGGVAFAAGEDLSLKAGFLVKLNSGKDLILPTSDQDITPYVITQGADQGYLCGAVPLSSAVNARVELYGTCDAGVLLVAKGDGRVTACTSGSAARVIGVAEEPGIDGQHGYISVDSFSDTNVGLNLLTGFALGTRESVYPYFQLKGFLSKANNLQLAIGLRF